MPEKVSYLELSIFDIELNYVQIQFFKFLHLFMFFPSFKEENTKFHWSLLTLLEGGKALKWDYSDHHIVIIILTIVDNSQCVALSGAKTDWHKGL